MLPDNYEARLGENIYLVEGWLKTKRRRGLDVAVFRSGRSKSASATAPVGSATLAPVTIPVTVLDERRQGYIKLVHRPRCTVVTVLELLSPANKNEPSGREYLAKRNALFVRTCI